MIVLINVLLWMLYPELLWICMADASEWIRGNVFWKCPCTVFYDVLKVPIAFKEIKKLCKSAVWV